MMITQLIRNILVLSASKAYENKISVSHKEYTKIFIIAQTKPQ